MPVLRRLSWLLLAWVMGGASPAAVSAPPSIPLTLDMDGRMTLTVRVNGAGPFRFRLDTGASRTLVGAGLVDQLGLPEAGRSTVLTHAGARALPMTALSDITFEDGTTVSASFAVVVDDVQLDRSLRVQGILGRDVLCQRPFTIDYRARRLTFGWVPAKAGSVTLPLSGSVDTLMALVHQPGMREPLRLLPDSGTDRLVLFDYLDGRLPPSTLLEAVRVRSVVGERPARLVRVHELDLGGLRLRDREAVLMDGGPERRVMGDGLLPLQLFARVSIDVREGVLVLEGRP